MSASEKWLTMTGAEYMAYLESLAANEATAPTLKVQSAAELCTDAERHADRVNDRATQARDRIKNLYGDKFSKFFETVALSIKSAEKFATASDTDPEWQVEGLIPRTGSGLHTGASGTLKSFAEIHLGAEVQRNGGKALNIVAEGARGYKRRLRAYAQHHGIALSDMPAVLPMAVNLFEEREVAALIEAIKLMCPDVTYLSFDTKWRCALGSEENSATDQAKVFAQIERLAKEFNCFVMCVAHLGKNKEAGVRGSSSQYAAVDVELMQERNGDYCTMTVTKAKDFEGDTVHTFKIVTVDLGRNALGEPETSLALEPVEGTPTAASVPPKGKQEVELYQLLKTKAPIHREDLLDEFAEQLKRNGTKHRRGNLRRTLESLEKKRLAFINADEEVSLTSNIVRDNAGWLDSE